MLQPSCVLSIASDQDVQNERAAIAAQATSTANYAREHARKPRRIVGATGEKADLINGLYEATDEEQDGYPCYQKIGDPDKWLVYFKEKKVWIIQNNSDRFVYLVFCLFRVC